MRTEISQPILVRTERIDLPHKDLVISLPQARRVQIPHAKPPPSDRWRPSTQSGRCEGDTHELAECPQFLSGRALVQHHEGSIVRNAPQSQKTGSWVHRFGPLAPHVTTKSTSAQDRHCAITPNDVLFPDWPRTGQRSNSAPSSGLAQDAEQRILLELPDCAVKRDVAAPRKLLEGGVPLNVIGDNHPARPLEGAPDREPPRCHPRLGASTGVNHDVVQGIPQGWRP